MIDLKSQTLEEMTATLKEMGEPAFRGKQVFTWLHKGVTSFDEMSNLSKPLREKAEGAVLYHSALRGPEAGFQAGRHHQVPVGAAGRQLHRNGGHAVPPWKHCLRFLTGGLPDGVRLLRVYNRRQGKRLNTI